MSSKSWAMEWLVNQPAHALIGFCCSLPVIGGFFSVIAREYYQTKGVMHEVYRLNYPDLSWTEIEKQLSFGKVMGKVKLYKLDLLVSYFGIGVSTAVMTYYFWKHLV